MSGLIFVQVLPAVCGLPVGVHVQQFDIQLVQAAGGLDVERISPNLLDGGDARQRQKEAEVVVEVGVGTGDGLAIDQLFGFDVAAVRRQCGLHLLAGRGGTVAQRGEGGRHLARRADRDMNVVPLQHPAGHVGLVRVARPQPFERNRLVAKGFEELLKKLLRIERGVCELRDGVFNFDGV